VKRFVLYVVGEGIEKKQDDFAAEVAAQAQAAMQAIATV
jgi:elongation factor Ts